MCIYFCILTSFLFQLVKYITNWPKDWRDFFYCLNNCRIDPRAWNDSLDSLICCILLSVIFRPGDR